MDDNNNELGSFLAGFVIGGLVGAAAALILAPQSGEETRTQIAGKSRDLRQTSGERLQQYRDMADGRTQEYRERAGGFVTDARSRVQETSGRMQEQARIVLDSGKDKASQVKAQVDTYIRKSEADNEEGDSPETTES